MQLPVSQEEGSVGSSERPKVALIVAGFTAAGIVGIAALFLWNSARGGGEVSGNASQPAGTPGTSSAETPYPSARAVDWGPLAVERGATTRDAAIGGRLSITDDCVLLVPEPSSEILLLWPMERTSWDAPSRTITFVNTDGSVIDLRDGMLVRMGGGGFSEAEADISIQEWLGLRDWVKPPADTCIGIEAWYMGERIDAE